MNRKSLNNYAGCLVGGAVGDALGAPVEFLLLSAILDQFGPDGIRNYAPAYGRRGAITDDTQMTLFTAEGLILHHLKYPTRPVEAIVHEAYLRWLVTQRIQSETALVARHGSCKIADGMLSGFSELHSRRAPGNACLSSLAGGTMGTMDVPINNSKGCGGVMRIAPVAMAVSEEEVFPVGCAVAAITHGHPTGYLAAGCQATIIHEILSGKELGEAISTAVNRLRRYPHHEECLSAIQLALDVWQHKPVSFQTVESIGKGWIAEEALAIGIYCALASQGDFEKGIWLAVNHSGDSDSTGAIAGNILGAIVGLDAIPKFFLDELELKDLIMEIAEDLFNLPTPHPKA